jgi:hypothetical protein
MKNKILQYAFLHQEYLQKHVVITQYPQGSEFYAFLDACRVSPSQRHHYLQKSHYVLKKKKKENQN